MARKIVACVRAYCSACVVSQHPQDVLGTLFDWLGITPALENEFGDAFRRAGVTSSFVAYFWYVAGQRDYTYTSMAGRYTPIAQVFKAILPRTIIMACEVLPADARPLITEEQVDRICSNLPKLPPRPGLAEAIRKLQDAGFEIWPVSNGAKAATIKLFENAHSASEAVQVQGLQEQTLSCDTVSAAKPDPRLYAHLKEQAKLENAGSSWFLAAHAWDLLAAKEAGFKTAYLTAEEHDGCPAIFGEPNVQADTLEELAAAIIRAS